MREPLTTGSVTYGAVRNPLTSSKQDGIIGHYLLTSERGHCVNIMQRRGQDKQQEMMRNGQRTMTSVLQVTPLSFFRARHCYDEYATSEPVVTVTCVRCLATVHRRTC